MPPPIIGGTNEGGDFPDTASITSGPDDPAALQAKLDVKGQLHGKILTRILQRQSLSQRHMTARYDDWDRVDEHLNLFIDLSRSAKRADKTVDPTKLEMPFDRAIVVPFAYAIHEVRKTQLFGLFAYREPLIEVDGRSPDDITNAQVMEATLAYDSQESQWSRVLYSLIADTEKYGLGIVYDTWEDEYGWKKTPPPPPPPGIMGLIQTIGEKAGVIPPAMPTKSWDVVRQYNRWENVDPYNFWPDPRTPVSNIQNAEFIGHRIYRGYSWLVERSQKTGGPYFNLDNLKKGNSGGGLAGAAAPRQVAIQRNRFSLDQFQLKESADEKDRGFYAIDSFQVKVIPKEWELGPGDKPEIWWFTVADATTIIRAHPSPYEHGRFTYGVAESNHNPHAIYNPGMVELLDGTQRFSNWLFNSHVENVRKIINDAIIYDPMLLEESDLLNSGPAKHIRLTTMGSQMLRDGVMPISSMYSQFIISDITAVNLKITQFVFDLMQRMSASNDPMMGQQTEEKRTLGEVQSIIAAGSQRIGVTARLMDSMCITPLAQRSIANRQQFTSLEQWIRVTGDLAKTALAVNGRMLLNQDNLAGEFDYVAIPGTMPADPARHAQVWMQILQTASQTPGLLMSADGMKKLDLTAIFGQATRAAGIRNLDQFYVDIQQNQLVQGQVQAGNMVPAAGVQAGPNGHIPGAGIQSPMVAMPGPPNAPPGQPPPGAAPPGTPPVGTRVGPGVPPPVH